MSDELTLIDTNVLVHAYAVADDRNLLVAIWRQVKTGVCIGVVASFRL